MNKTFLLNPDAMQNLAVGYGSCVASDMITVEGKRIGFMYREEPSDEIDSGWRFLSGYEDDIYTENPANFEIYDVNTIANYDPSIVRHLDSPIGSAFERQGGSEEFALITD